MEIVLSIYITGVIFVFILLMLLAKYYIKYEPNQCVNISQSIIVCLLSWFIAIPMMIIYRDKYNKLFTHINKNEKEEI